MVQWVGQEPSWVCCQQPRGGIIIRAGGFSTPSSPIRIWIQLDLNRAIYCARVILGHFAYWGCLVHTLMANCSLRRQPLRWEWQEKKNAAFFHYSFTRAFSISASRALRVVGVPQPIPAVSWQTVGLHPGHVVGLLQGHAERQTTVHTRTQGQVRVCTSSHDHVSGLCEEAREPEEKPCTTRGENTSSTQEGYTGLESKPHPSCCETAHSSLSQLLLKLTCRWSYKLQDSDLIVAEAGNWQSGRNSLKTCFFF